MTNQWNCVLLADQHHGLRDSVRGLLEMEFDTVFMVATEAALLEGAGRLSPVVVVVDFSLAAGDLSGLLHRIGARAPGAKLLLLSVHDEGTVADAALAAGADGVVLKR
jgi:DNA-binding NarL/FixJ family response regulator